jgi:phosphate/phosphite/phosphonate ABC transporters, periplasmic binding protein
MLQLKQPINNLKKDGGSQMKSFASKKIICAVLSAGMMLATFSAGFSSAAAASAAKAPSTFVIAYLPGDATSKNGPARSAMEKDLAKAIGIPVKEAQVSDYNAAIEAMRVGKVDMAFFGPLSFALAYKRADAQLVGMIGTKKDGKAKAFYNSLFIVKAGSAMKSIKDIKGKKIAFVDPDSTSGNLVPCGEIMNKFPNDKLTLASLHTNGKFFESAIYTNSHPASMQAVVKGDVDVAPVASDELKGAEDSGTIKASDIKIIYKSQNIPNSPMAIWGKLPTTLKTKVTNFLLGYKNNDYFKNMLGYDGGCFFKTSLSDYQGIINLYNKLYS